jgi:dTDP-4-dehydrorhamnose 3,5-epimerase-like enzyme
MPKLITIRSSGESENGYLSYFESNIDFPFEIKRVYYIYGVKEGSKRGMHAHKELSQILWCPYGKIEILLDNGVEKKNYMLDSPTKALLIERGFWRVMYWHKDSSVLCVAASDYYNEEDYIRDYSEFLKYFEKGYWNNENKF